MNASTYIVYAALFRRLACCPAAFCAVWGGQPKGETPLADHKLHAARVRVCVGLTALAGVGCGIGGQPVLEVGVVGADIDQRFFFRQTKFLWFSDSLSILFSYTAPFFVLSCKSDFFRVFSLAHDFEKTKNFKQERARRCAARPTRSCWLFSYFYGSTP